MSKCVSLGGVFLVLGAIVSGTPVFAQAPTITANGVVNAANGFTTVSAGSVISIFGSNLASGSALATGAPLPSILAGATVKVNGATAPLFFASPTQINLQMPWEVAGQSFASVTVTTSAGASAPAVVAVAPTAPGLFTSGNAGQGNILHSDFSLVTTASPAVTGETIIILGTGFGTVSNTPATGAAAPANSLLIATPIVTIGGQQATVTFAGLAPGSVGFGRIDAVVPPPLGVGSFLVQVTAGGVSSNLVSLAGTGSGLFHVAGPAVNGASFIPAISANGAIAPGAIVSIFGSNLAPSVGRSLSVPLSNTLNGVSVTFNDINAPVYYVSPGQLNVQAPYSISPGSATLRISNSGGSSSSTVKFAAVSPGIFTAGQNGTGNAIAFHADGRLITAAAPAMAGESMILYGAGFGLLASSVPEGTLSPATPVATQVTPVASFDGLPGLVTFSGMAPMLIGVNQLNVQLPSGLPTGSAALSLQAAGISSNIVTVPALFSGGTISAGSLKGLTNSSVSVPLTLFLASGATLDHLSFTVTVTPGVGAPGLSASLDFQPALSTFPSVDSSVPGTIQVSFTGLNPMLSGMVPLGSLVVPIPAAAAGKIYNVQVTSAAGGAGASSVSVIPGAAGTVSAFGGLIGSGAAQTMPNGTLMIPITFSLAPGVPADSVAFGFSVNPAGLTPVIAGPLTFHPDPAFPSPLVDNGALPNFISVTLLNLPNPFSGTVHLGDVWAPVPASAKVGQSYNAAFTAVTASRGSSPISVDIGTSAPLAIGGGYLVGDSFPSVADTFGSFGDAQINTLDLIATLRAVTKIPGFSPAVCSDRFDAMDSFPLDTAGQRGGDGTLDTLDLIEALKRTTNVDPSRPVRLPRGLSCPSAAQSVASVTRRSGTSGAEVSFGEAQSLGHGVTRVPIYLDSPRGFAWQGLSLGLGVAGRSSKLRFTPAQAVPPSIVDNGVEGTLAVAWLDGLKVPSGHFLLGFVEVSGSREGPHGGLRFFDISFVRSPE